jgi:hypothetical protein
MSTQQHTRAAAAAAAAAAGGTNSAVSVASTAAVIAAAGGVAPAPVERKADELQAVPECAGSSCLAVAAASVPYNAAAHSMARHDTAQQYSTMSVQQAETGRAGVRLANTTLIPTLHSTNILQSTLPLWQSTAASMLQQLRYHVVPLLGAEPQSLRTPWHAALCCTPVSQC